MRRNNALVNATPRAENWCNHGWKHWTNDQINALHTLPAMRVKEELQLENLPACICH